MNSTGGPAGSHGVIRWPLTRCGWVFAAVSCLAFAPALAQDNPMPRPPQLERDVQFWIRVYTQIDTNAGLLHDQYNLSVVYDTLHFAPNTTPAERERQVDQARERCGAALRRIADAADAPLSADDERIKELWGAEGTPARLRSAIEDIRSEEHTSELQSPCNLVCRLLLEKKKKLNHILSAKHYRTERCGRFLQPLRCRRTVRRPRYVHPTLNRHSYVYLSSIQIDPLGGA